MDGKRLAIRGLAVAALWGIVGLSAACGGTANVTEAQDAPPLPTTLPASAVPAASTTGAAASQAVKSGAPILAVVSEAQEGPCLVTTMYKHGAHVILRIKLFDPATGKQLSNKDLAGVDVVLPDGTKLPAHFGTHEGGKIPFWVAHWTIPAGYPTGNVKYSVTAQGTNRQVKQVRFDVTDTDAFLTVLKGTAKTSA